VIASEMLRPTPDRVRETLFNWIGPAVRGTRCLDLFAGTGILGLEALSRGAAQVVWIEADIRLVRALRQIQATLQAGGEVVCGDVTDWLTGFDPARSAPFDLVFLDPPFRRGLLEQVVQQLEQRALLSPQALIYLEHEREHQPALPPN
jgi:16S rRNA (guanine966-N2)-methyltransferase